MKITIRKIDIFQVSPVGNSLLAEMIATCPSEQKVDGCEVDDQKITAVLSRGSSPHVLSRYNGKPPRGEFDLRDAGATLIINDHLFSENTSTKIQHLMRHPGCIIVPVRTVEHDLEICKRLISPEWFEAPTCQLIILKTGEAPTQYVDEFSRLGPIALVPYHHRNQEIDREAFVNKTRVGTFKTDKVLVSHDGALEGEGLWKWLLDSFQLPLPRR